MHAEYENGAVDDEFSNYDAAPPSLPTSTSDLGLGGVGTNGIITHHHGSNGISAPGSLGANTNMLFSTTPVLGASAAPPLWGVGALDEQPTQWNGGMSDAAHGVPIQQDYGVGVGVGGAPAFVGGAYGAPYGSTPPTPSALLNGGGGVYNNSMQQQNMYLNNNSAASFAQQSHRSTVSSSSSSIPQQHLHRLTSGSTNTPLTPFTPAPSAGLLPPNMNSVSQTFYPGLSPGGIGSANTVPPSTPIPDLKPSNAVRPMIPASNAKGGAARMNEVEVLARVGIHMGKGQYHSQLEDGPQNGGSSNSSNSSDQNHNTTSINSTTPAQPPSKRPRITDKDRRDTIRDGLEQLRSLVFPPCLSKAKNASTKVPSQATIISASICRIKTLEKRLEEAQKQQQNNSNNAVNNSTSTPGGTFLQQAVLQQQLQQQQAQLAAQQQALEDSHAQQLQEENKQLKDMLQQMQMQLRLVETEKEKIMMNVNSGSTSNGSSNMNSPRSSAVSASSIAGGGGVGASTQQQVELSYCTSSSYCASPTLSSTSSSSSSSHGGEGHNPKSLTISSCPSVRLDTLLYQLSKSGVFSLDDNVCKILSDFLLSDLLNTRLPSSGCMIWRVSSHGRIIEVNDEFCRQVGYHPSSVLGKTPCDLPLRCGMSPIPNSYLNVIVKTKYRKRAKRERGMIEMDPEDQGHDGHNHSHLDHDHGHHHHNHNHNHSSSSLTLDASCDTSNLTGDLTGLDDDEFDLDMIQPNDYLNLSTPQPPSSSMMHSSHSHNHIGDIRPEDVQKMTSFSVSTVPPLPASSLDNFFPHNCPHVSSGGDFDAELNSVARLHASHMLRTLQEQREKRRQQQLGSSMQQYRTSTFNNNNEQNNNSSDIMPNLLCLLTRLHTANGNMLECIVGLTLDNIQTRATLSSGANSGVSSRSISPNPMTMNPSAVAAAAAVASSSPPTPSASAASLPRGISEHDTILVFAPSSCRRSIPKSYSHAIRPMIYQSPYGTKQFPVTFSAGM